MSGQRFPRVRRNHVSLLSQTTPPDPIELLLVAGRYTYKIKSAASFVGGSIESDGKGNLGLTVFAPGSLAVVGEERTDSYTETPLNKSQDAAGTTFFSGTIRFHQNAGAMPSDWVLVPQPNGNFEMSSTDGQWDGLATLQVKY
jgi:hypothetical protein